MNRATHLIAAEDLSRQLHSGSELPRIVDCRFDLFDPESGRKQWLEGHIPGAVYADLNDDLSDLSQAATQGRHPLPDPNRFARRLAEWGIASDTPVVAYDQGPGALAARLWWLLRSAGYRRVRVLDGGLKAWRRGGGELESGQSSVAPVEAPQWVLPRERWVGNAQLKRALSKGSALLIDAREAARYRGEVEPIDPVAGHIPGAVNRPFTENLDASGCFKAAEALRLAFDELRGSHAPKQLIHQCGSGVTACHNLLAMEIAGLHGSRLHAPSWSGWLAETAQGTGPRD